MIRISGENVNEVFCNALWMFKSSQSVLSAGSRNGPVLEMECPSVLAYSHPRERVLFAPERDANPFFHFMEGLWMLAGCNDVAFPATFAQNIKNYSDDGKTLNGAYGWRWREQFSIDQICWVIELLKREPTTRRAVIGMWDPMSDPWAVERNTKDVPCNTHIYFRVTNGVLDMTVCNRSNDLIWGACGANAVHMSMLHEFVALAVGVPIGIYYQFTNNLHVYTDLPMAIPLIDRPPCVDHYKEEDPIVCPFPMMQKDEEYKKVLTAIEEFVCDPLGERYKSSCVLIEKVARPMFTAWCLHKSGLKEEACRQMHQVEASDWRLAGLQWLQRRNTVV